MSALGQASPRVLPVSRDRPITFSATKPVLGLPLDGNRQQGLCSSDGLTYFDPPANTTGDARVLDLYSVASSGDVKLLTRTVPIEFTNVINRDFFPGDAALVALIEAQKRDTNDPDVRPREIRYYLSVSDHDGDGKDLVTLDIHFKPLKVAQYGSGEFLVLGWEDGNKLAQLAVLKGDGTVRRFLDFEENPADSRSGSQTGAVTGAGETLASLAGAAFVPFGRNVLLTYPGTLKPIHVLNESGQGASILLDYPPGYLLHDVLNSGDGFTIVARLQEMTDLQTDKTGDSVPPRLRMFEFVRQTGRRIREFTFDQVPLSAVTCAGNRSLAAVFEQPAGTEQPKNAATDAKNGEQSTQLVVGTVLR